jgi:hypothetical protein
MVKKLAFVSLVGMAFAWSSCETEFSLNGDYEITPVVFGLLDHRQDVHIIKITKAFLGDGDNLEYAQNPDSNYFETVDAKVIEYKNGNATGREWQLTDSVITNKDTTGIFYGPEQKVYVFYESDLDSTAEYELIADLNEGQHQISAKTEMINGFNVAANLLFPTTKINFASNNVAADEDYKYWTFTVTEGKNGSRYNYKYTFHWTEYYTDLTSQSFSATRNNGDQEQLNPSVGGGAQVASFSGLDFYQWIATIMTYDPNVTQRRFNGIDLKISVAHKDLDQYLDVAKPVSGIAQTQPEFTNINGGLGLFSSRLIFERLTFRLDTYSMKELCTGNYTADLVFCSHYPEDISESWYCP